MNAWLLTPFDWTCIAVLAGSLLLGLWRGLVHEMLSLAGWLLAFVAAQRLGPLLAPYLGSEGAQALRTALAFAIVFIATVVVFSLFTRWVKSLVSAAGLRPIDRLLGAVFGVLRGLVVLAVMALLVVMTPLRQGDWWQQSLAHQPLTRLVGLIQGSGHALGAWDSLIFISPH